MEVGQVSISKTSLNSEFLTKLSLFSDFQLIQKTISLVFWNCLVTRLTSFFNVLSLPKKLRKIRAALKKMNTLNCWNSENVKICEKFSLTSKLRKVGSFNSSSKNVVSPESCFMQILKDLVSNWTVLTETKRIFQRNFQIKNSLLWKFKTLYLFLSLYMSTKLWKIFWCERALRCKNTGSGVQSIYEYKGSSLSS